MNRTRRILISFGVTAALAINVASPAQAFGGWHRAHDRHASGGSDSYPGRFVSPRFGDSPPRSKHFGYGLGYGTPSRAVRF